MPTGPYWVFIGPHLVLPGQPGLVGSLDLSAVWQLTIATNSEEFWGRVDIVDIVDIRVDIGYLKIRTSR